MKHIALSALSAALLFSVSTIACAQTLDAASEKPAPVTTDPWQETLVSVSDLDRTAAFFREIGQYETLFQGPLTASEIAGFDLPDGATGEALLLKAPGSEHGFIRLVRFDDAGRKVPTRPGARAWDTGCFWSIMVRVKDMEAVYDQAIELGWWTQTPITYLEFGPSKLNVVVFQGPDGVQVQGYERLTTDVPEGFPPFEKISQPFNIMQMVRNREAARVLMEDVLGFDRFWFGEPYTDTSPTFMPLGSVNLTTTIPYMAGIFYPVESEFGRMEFIEIDGLDGHDFADRCHAPNLGTLAVTYPVENVDQTARTITERGGEVAYGPARQMREPYGEIDLIRVKAPDGATIEFFSLAPVAG